MAREIVQAKYSFTKNEMKDIAEKMAERQGDLNIAENEKKSVLSQFKDKIDRVKLDIQVLSRNYRDGYEHRDYECNVVKDFKRKEVVFKDVHTGKVVLRKQFGPGDAQHEMKD